MPSKAKFKTDIDDLIGCLQELSDELESAWGGQGDPPTLDEKETQNALFFLLVTAKGIDKLTDGIMQAAADHDFVEKTKEKMEAQGLMKGMKKPRIDLK